MKRILLSCFLLIALANTAAFAQAKHNYSKVPVAPKSLFSAQILRFDGYVSGGAITSANKVLDSMMSEMNTEAMYTQLYMNDDSVSHSPAGLPWAANRSNIKMNSLNKINALKSNVTTNKTTIDTELNKFLGVWD